MKKLLAFLPLLCILIASNAQEKTLNVSYYKVKLGHRALFNKAMEEHNAKYRPANSSFSIVVYNLMGGEHNNEVLILSNLGKSFKERDNAPAPPAGAQDDVYNTIHPQLEAITGGDLLVYKAEYSNSAFSDRADKAVTTTYFLKGVGADFWNIVKKLPAAWNKAGIKIAAYMPSTGSSRLVLTKRLPNGWGELDENKNLSKAYDEVYGIGSYEKDMQVFRGGINTIDRVMMTLNKGLSSK